MGAIASQITSLTIVYSTIYSDADQRKHQSSASLAFVWEIHRGPVNSPHKWPVTRKMFPFDDVIMMARITGKYHMNPRRTDELTNTEHTTKSFVYFMGYNTVDHMVLFGMLFGMLLLCWLNLYPL